MGQTGDVGPPPAAGPPGRPLYRRGWPWMGLVGVLAVITAIGAASGPSSPSATPVASSSTAGPGQSTAGPGQSTAGPGSPPEVEPPASQAAPRGPAQPQRDDDDEQPAAATKANPTEWAPQQPPSGPGPQSGPAPGGNTLSDGGWGVSQILTEHSAEGTQIRAEVTNIEERSRSGRFALTIVGPDGKAVRSAQASVSDVPAGGTAMVTFVAAAERLPGDPAGFRYQFHSIG